MPSVLLRPVGLRSAAPSSLSAPGELASQPGRTCPSGPQKVVAGSDARCEVF